jgi:hypothetical protein
MSLTFIGPVALSAHYDPSFTWTSEASPVGIRGVSISGRLDWDHAKMLSELIDNPDRRVQFGGATGILEPVWATDDLQRDFNGWYLLQSCSIGASVRDSLTDIVPFDIGAQLVSARHEPIIVHSARARTNDYSITPKATIVQPFWGDDAEGEPFATPPGGTAFARDYDSRTIYDPREPTTTNRRLRIHVDSLT